MTAQPVYRCQKDHVGQRGPDGGCMRCRADASKRYRDRQRSNRALNVVDYGAMAASTYRDYPKSLSEHDARADRLERQQAARVAARKGKR